MKIKKETLEIVMATKCMTAKELSVMAGVSQITISRIKNGLQAARPSTIGKIAKALGVPVESLVDM